MCTESAGTDGMFIVEVFAAQGEAEPVFGIYIQIESRAPPVLAVAKLAVGAGLGKATVPL